MANNLSWLPYKWSLMVPFLGNTLVRHNLKHVHYRCTQAFLEIWTVYKDLLSMLSNFCWYSPNCWPICWSSVGTESWHSTLLQRRNMSNSSARDMCLTKRNHKFNVNSKYEANKLNCTICSAHNSHWNIIHQDPVSGSLIFYHEPGLLLFLHSIRN